MYLLLTNNTNNVFFFNSDNGNGVLIYFSL